MKSWIRHSLNYRSSTYSLISRRAFLIYDRYSSSQNMAQVTVTGQTFADLLSVSPQYLDGEAEMRKFFGSKVVTANKETSGPAGPSRRKAAVIRSQLTRPKPTWWAAKGREGLSIRSLTEDEVNARLKRHDWQPMPQEKWWTVEFSKRYKSLTKVFMGIVYSGGTSCMVWIDRMANVTGRSTGILGSSGQVPVACGHTLASVRGVSTS